MVGALADWFAVTALFRHPLGLPIPHTAIIAKRKDEIGRSLGEFVQGNFLTREVIAERLAGVHVGQRLGALARRAGPTPNGPAAAVGRRARRRGRGARRPRRAGRPRRHGRATPARRPRSPRCSAGRSTWRSTATTTSGCSTSAMRGVAGVPRREPRRRSASASSRSRRGGCPSRSTTACSTRSSTACSASSPTSAPTRDHEVRRSVDARVARPRRPAAHRPGADRQVRVDEARAARPPRGAGVAAARCGAS